MGSLKSQHWLKWALPLSLAAAVGLWMAGPRTAEPTYHGKRLSYWTTHLYGVEFDEAFAAIRSIGPDGVPWLLQQVRSNHAMWRRLYLRAWPKVPRRLKSHLSPPHSPDELDEKVLQALGVLRASGAPPLVSALMDHNRAVCRVAALALGRVALTDKMVEQSAPSLCRLLADPDPAVRSAGMETLYRMRSAPDAVVPAVIAAITQRPARTSHSAEFDPTALAIQLLGNMRSVAQPAVPILEPFMNATNELIRVQAAVALWRIQHEPKSMAALLEQMERSPGQAQQIYESLLEIGPDATACVPTLAAAFATTNQAVKLAVLHTFQCMELPMSSLPTFAEALSDPAPGVANLSAELLLLRNRRREAFVAHQVQGSRTGAAAFPVLISEDEVDATLLRDLGIQMSAGEAKQSSSEPGESSSVRPAALQRLLRDPNAAVRLGAAVALWRVHQSTNGLSVMVDQLNSDADARSCHKIFAALGEMGTAGLPALPALERRLTNTSIALPPSVRQAGWNVLARIDPQRKQNQNQPLE